MNELQWIKDLGLEEHHWKFKKMRQPVIDSSLYTSLGLRLFELYEKYHLPADAQREIERLAFLLQTFTVHRRQIQSRHRWWKIWRRGE